MLASTLAGLLVYAISAVCMYRELAAGRPTLENPHPEHITGFPAWAAFVAALYYAIPAAIVVFVLAACAFGIPAALHRRRRSNQNI